MSHNCASCGEFVEKGHMVDECLKNLEVKRDRLNHSIKELIHKTLQMSSKGSVSVGIADTIENLADLFNKLPKNTLISLDSTLDVSFGCSYNIKFRYNFVFRFSSSAK